MALKMQVDTCDDFDSCLQYIIDHINDGRYLPQNYLDETRHKLQIQADQIRMPTRMLSGGLHRDGYLIMLTGNDEDAATFAVWLRSVITAEHILRFYPWADYGVIIQPDMTAAQLAQRSDKASEHV